MLVVRPEQKFFQKIFRTETGEFIRATFIILEFQGQYRARLISAETIDAQTIDGNKYCALPQAISETNTNFTYTSPCHDIESPYSDFSFFTSQQTRAPSYNI